MVAFINSDTCVPITGKSNVLNYFDQIQNILNWVENTWKVPTCLNDDYSWYVAKSICERVLGCRTF